MIRNKANMAYWKNKITELEEELDQAKESFQASCIHPEDRRGYFGGYHCDVCDLNLKDHCWRRDDTGCDGIMVHDRFHSHCTKCNLNTDTQGD